MIEWKEQYSVGNRELDEQHKRIIEIINQMSSELAKNHADEHQIFITIIDQLLDYTQYHFTTEELLMRESAFTGLSSHIKVHTSLVENLLLKKERIVKKEFITAMEMVVFLEEWLIDHILGEDMKYKGTVKPS